MNAIIFLAIGLFALLLRSFVTPSKNEPTKYCGNGVIQNRFQEDGRIYFYVRFVDYNGIQHVGKSIPYKSTKRKYFEGDFARIKYYFSPKGKAFVSIEDEDLISCEQGANTIARFLLVLSVIFFVLAVGALFFDSLR